MHDAPEHAQSVAAGDPAARDAADGERASAAGLRLLSAGVPLTLLLDLSLPVDSAAIAATEGGSAAWLDG